MLSVKTLSSLLLYKSKVVPIFLSLAGNVMMPVSCFLNLSMCVCVCEELYLYGMAYCNISPQALG